MTNLSEGKEFCDKFLKTTGLVIFNKEKEFRLSLICFLAQGHLLIEDIPGVGKTTFVKTLGKVLGLHFGRIQFTNDLLPADIIGSSIYDMTARNFHFHKGPLFAELLLIDELNRATPKTQSALLQAMEERQVTVDGQTLSLPEPFFIVATQNPRYQLGTFSLPESQLDRFMMRIQLGYPGAAAEKNLLMGSDAQDRLSKITPITEKQKFLKICKDVNKVHVSESLAHYIQNLLEQSRKQQKDIIGLSPRAGLSLAAASRAWAYLEGRDRVIPEDVQSVAISVINHRLSHVDTTYQASSVLAQDLVKSVEIA